jgi:hypothetical protein
MAGVAEELGSSASGAKALAERKAFIAALEALRHPKSSFSANCKARMFSCALAARLKEASEKRSLPKKQQPQGLKPELISRGLRGPEEPLFHGKAAHL